MSAWRRKALEYLPSCRNTIQHADSASFLWCELSCDFRNAVKKNDQTFVDGTLKYLRWCTGNTASKEIQQAVYCGFLEDISHDKSYWPYFKDWFSKAEFEQYKGSFSYSLSENDLKSLEDDLYGR